MNNIRGFVVGQRSIFNKVIANKGFVRCMSFKGGASNLPESEDGKAFYALGINIARQVSGQLKTILSKEELEYVAAGFRASLTDSTGNEGEILQTYGPRLNDLLQSRDSKVANEEKDKGNAFGEKYLKDHPTAKRLDSGLIYHETVPGLGTQATADSKVLVHYHGTFTNGEVFDSSVNRGEPIEFPLKNVIPGWQEGVAKMKVGGKATLVVPSNLAYGDSGSPPVIPPGATLRFDVELLNVQ